MLTSYTASAIWEQLPTELCKRIQEIVGSYRNIKREYELPDGEMVYLDKERFLCSEILFSPATTILPFDTYRRPDTPDPSSLVGVHVLIVDAIAAASGDDAELRRKLFSRMVLGGGTSSLTGLGNRLKREVRKEWQRRYPEDNLLPLDQMRVIVLGSEAAWMGAVILAHVQHDQLVELSVTKRSYDERCKAIGKAPKPLRPWYA
jgi:actin-related protein